MPRFSLKKLTRWLLLPLLAGFMAAGGAITLSGLRDYGGSSDLAVVPGNTVTPDGRPSPRLQGRLDAALRLYRAWRCKAILVSGGIGKEGYDEALVMKAYLVAQGVAPLAIYTDSHGINTFETARYTAALLQREHLREPLLVSQFYHLPRFHLAMKRHGVQTGGQAHSQVYELRDLYSLFREVIGYPAYLVKKP